LSVFTTEAPPSTRTANFTCLAWFLVAWSLLVVLWGAYVRASDSGAGCGGHWPLCNGEIVPVSPSFKTIVEFTHRVTSGVTLIATFALAAWSFFLFPRGHRVRRAAVLSVIFVIVEALLGAGLVLFNYVEHNSSVGRVAYLCLHLVNTQLLLAALALTAWFSRSSSEPLDRRRRLVSATLPIAILVSITGVIAALGDTLFPAAHMQQDFSAGAHFLLRLRILHPVLAILGACYFVFASIAVLRSSPRPLTARIASIAIFLALAQLGAGAMNLALLAPIPMQIAHLFLADLVWLTLVLLTVESAASENRENR
jgi:cytochrome c oxidase assembly protein subunit 15